MLSDIISFLGGLIGSILARLFRRNPNVTPKELLKMDQKDEELQAKVTSNINNELKSVDDVIDKLPNEGSK